MRMTKNGCFRQKDIQLYEKTNVFDKKDIQLYKKVLQ
jgi:hypothetical protein